GHRDVHLDGHDVLAPADRSGTGADGGTVVDYDAVLAQVLDLLQQEQRLSYRVLKHRLHLDNDVLEDLKEDLIYAKKLAVDEDGRVLVWAGGTSSAAPTASPVALPATSEVSPTQVGASPGGPTMAEAERRQL